MGFPPFLCLKEINPCLEKNGGCDKNAECTHTGPNKVKQYFHLVLTAYSNNIHHSVSETDDLQT